MTVLFFSFLIGELHFFYAHPGAREDDLDEPTLSFPNMSKAPFMVNINLYISCDRGSVCIKKGNLRLSGVSKQLFSFSKFFFCVFFASYIPRPARFGWVIPHIMRENFPEKREWFQIIRTSSRTNGLFTWSWGTPCR